MKNIDNILQYIQINDKKINSWCGEIELKHYTIGNITLPSGRIIAADPFTLYEDEEPFKQKVQPGEYPVVLSIADIDCDQRVAFAVIKFNNSAPVLLEMALTEGQDIKELKKNQEISGYGVDSGTGCFMDQVILKKYIKKIDSDDEFLDDLMDEMHETYINTWSYLNKVIDEKSKGNIIAFSSGYGDGFYTSYFGYDKDKNLCCLVTDFGLTDPKHDNDEND